MAMETAVASIDLNALKQNVQHIQNQFPDQKILPMIKGNAYGHGMTQVARALHELPALGVARLSEALLLREQGITQPIVVMRGFCDESELVAFVQDPNLIAGVHTPSQLHILRQYRFNAGDQVNCWLKVDTGMHRLGFDSQDIHFIFQQLSMIDAVNTRVMFTHLASANDNAQYDFTKNQLAVFQALDIPVEKSILNSAGIFMYPDAAFDWVRPGLAIYGVAPIASDAAQVMQQSLSPVMTLSSRVIAVKEIVSGAKVGYGCEYTAAKAMHVAVVGIGYGDGYPRHATTGTPVLIHGKRCPIVGRISMDMMTVDVSHLSKVKVVAGDQVTLWGNGLPVEEIAVHANTIPYELLSHMTDRVKYQYH